MSKQTVCFISGTAEYRLVYPDALVNLALSNKKKDVPLDVL